jgi:thermitase
MRKRKERQKIAADGSSKRQLGHRTFQGRRVVTVEWRGRKIDVIAGRFALKRKELSSGPTDTLIEHLTSAISHPVRPTRRDIEVIQLDPQIDMSNLTEVIKTVAAKYPDIEWIEPISVSRGSSAPNDERYTEQWGLKATRFEQAVGHASGNVNRVVLAILDTGVPLVNGKLSHPDLSGEQRFFIGPDIIGSDDDPSDDHGHGTHIAGIAAANTNNQFGVAGVWPGPVYVIKVLDAYNRGSSEGFAEGVHSAIQFAQDRQAQLVVNFSGHVDGDQFFARDAIEGLLASNGVLVAAAGNNFGFSVDYPAAYSVEFSNVIAVGAVDRQGNRPEFASRGPEINVVAPGVGILSTLPNYHVTLNNTENHKSLKYDVMDGTSQAAAFVSAQAALIWTKWPQVTAQQVRTRILETATPINGPTEDYGSGIINLERALA